METLVTVVVGIFIFLFGITIGSFLNVCILRLPAKESIVTTRSHCMNCGYQLAWYDLFPLFSYLLLRGRCRKCKAHISAQYPIVEALNGFLYIFIFLANGFSIQSVLYCLLTSALIVLSVIDWRTYEIPFCINVFIFVLGIIRVAFDYKNWSYYVIGFISIGGFLLILYLLTRGRGIGGGDVKLMAAAGLLLGWKEIVFAFFAGCIIGSIGHISYMKIKKDSNHMLAFGPYLSVGILISMFVGKMFFDWYIQSFL